MGWNYLGLLLLVSAVLCAIGFYKYVYFLSIGYGFSVAGIGICLMVLGGTRHLAISLPLYLLCILFVLYGARLSGFLLFREKKNVIYQKTLQEATGKEERLAILPSLGIWGGVSILYVAQTSPVFYRLYNDGGVSAFVWIGIIICIAAILLESVADLQKSEQKKSRPDMVATKGLYRIVRCPNYLGEILFWTGVLVSGLDTLTGVGQWLMGLIAYACILYIMFDGAKRLEIRQMKRYKGNKEYEEYANHTPILLPGVSLYHLTKQ